MRIAIVLPGLHRVVRGAEVAFESMARELAKIEGVQVTLFGSGQARENEPYQFEHINNISRENFEKWPHFPILRSEYVYEELTFIPGLIPKYQPQNFDLTVTCSYPFTNWFLRLKGGKNRPRHVFVTQNGDYPAQTNNREYRYFSCDGLVCTNPEYFERNQNQWFCQLIPNGVDPNLFFPGKSERSAFNIPENVPIALMVSALIKSKRVAEGIKAASQIKDLHLVVCGDGPERENINKLGSQLMGDRFHLRKFPREVMPNIYRLADLFLHTSLDEPSANAYIEALATGLPIVTHDRRVTQWTLENTAFLVDATDQNEIVKGIKQALNGHSEAEINARRALVKSRFSWSEIAQSYYQFFEEVLAKT